MPNIYTFCERWYVQFYVFLIIEMLTPVSDIKKLLLCHYNDK